MNTYVILWIAGLVLALSAFAQWVFLRSRYIGELTEQRTRHAQQMQNAGQCIDQAKRQIAQLQVELGNARSLLARHAARQAELVASRSVAAKLSQQLRPDASVARRAEPCDGFADTLPAPQYPHDAGLLTTYPAHR